MVEQKHKTQSNQISSTYDISIITLKPEGNWTNTSRLIIALFTSTQPFQMMYDSETKPNLHIGSVLWQQCYSVSLTGWTDCGPVPHQDRNTTRQPTGEGHKENNKRKRRKRKTCPFSSNIYAHLFKCVCRE